MFGDDNIFVRRYCRRVIIIIFVRHVFNVFYLHCYYKNDCNDGVGFMLSNIIYVCVCMRIARTNLFALNRNSLHVLCVVLPWLGSAFTLANIYRSQHAFLQHSTLIYLRTYYYNINIQKKTFSDEYGSRQIHSHMSDVCA